MENKISKFINDSDIVNKIIHFFMILVGIFFFMFFIKSGLDLKLSVGQAIVYGIFLSFISTLMIGTTIYILYQLFFYRE